MAIEERVDQLIQKFKPIEDWEDRYKLVIQMGKSLPELPDEYRINDLLVKGCQSQVWLHANLSEDGKIKFQADSDAMIVKGLVSILLSVYSGSSPDEILTTPPSFLKELGFEANLTPSRANGLYSMVKQIQFYAMAFKAKISAGNSV